MVGGRGWESTDGEGLGIGMRSVGRDEGVGSNDCRKGGGLVGVWMGRGCGDEEGRWGMGVGRGERGWVWERVCR